IGESPRRPVAAVRAQPQENTEPAASALTTLRQGLFDRFKIRRTMAGDDDDSAELMDDDPVQDALATVTHLDEERESLEEHVAPIAEPSEVLVVNVMAAHGRRFAGHDLMEVLVGSGMKFGDMNIFHQRLSAEKRAPVIFSVANILNPGTFDLNNMESFSTPGISLFLALPTAINNLDALERMLKCARDLAGQLGGEMKDDNRNGMTGQTIEHYRQRVRDFELRRLKSAASRG
ncbi:MAG: cell division protein ZipA, partial [Gammaproteobacteria bacterium]